MYIYIYIYIDIAQVVMASEQIQWLSRKTVNFRYRSNNHIVVCRSEEHPPINSTILFLNVIIKLNMLPRNRTLKFMLL